MAVTSTAAAVGAYLSLLQSGCLDAVGCAPTAAVLVPSHDGAIQQQRAGQSRCSQQQPQQQQAAPLPMGQACLLANVWASQAVQQRRSSQQHQHLLLYQHHHPWQQLWPSQWRSLCSSAAVCSSSRDSPPTWPGAVPPLHQPSKHVTGTNPLRPRPIRVAPEAAAAEQTAAEAPAVLAAREPWLVRLRANAVVLRSSAIVLLLCFTSATALALMVEPILLASLPGQLGCGDAVVQKIGLHRLEQVLRWRPLPVVGDLVLQALIQRDILAALVALLQPGTDAVVLVTSCEVIKGLLDSPLALAAMQQAGLSEAVSMGLEDGWIPTGALQTARGLQKRLLLARS